MLILQDRELRLRPALMGDVPTALEWYSDPEVLWFSEGRHEKYDLRTVERMYSYLMGSGEFYIIEVLDGTLWLPVGDSCLMRHSTPIVIGRAGYRSQGIGRKVLSLLIERAKSLGWAEMNVKGLYQLTENIV